MYSTSHPVSSSMNGMGGGMMNDGSGTINPAALNTPVPVLPQPSSLGPANPNRGTKRSRSPETYNDAQSGQADDEERRRKRGRPPKTRLPGTEVDSPTAQTPQSTQQQPPTQANTPLQSHMIAAQTNVTPAQASPPVKTPKSVVKALPTVRDHTTDQLNPEGDEYIPREYDEAGEKKVSPNGVAQSGREYKCRTFLVPNRGDKLFMLATECARVLGYRDSYLLFNKNRSLYKIIATQPEKDDLISQEILPYSYRSRQIAIVTAKSMFRQFGSRVITNGRRVRDDYWEAKAKKQGFTEDDLAGEKRPGGGKAAREAQAADAVNAAVMGHPHQDVIYSNGPGTIPTDGHGHPQILGPGMGGSMASSLAPLPMIHLPSEDMRLPGYPNIPRPRQEMTGVPYHDQSRATPIAEIMNHSNHAADFNNAVNQQSRQRSKKVDEFYTQQRREPPASTPVQQSTEPGQALGQNLQSPQLTSGGLINSAQQPMLQHQTSQMMPSQTYSQPHHQNASQSPVRNMQPQLRSDQIRSSSLAYPPGGIPQGSNYGYQSSQMWGQPPPQPQQSPLASQHSIPQYNQPPHSSHSPHPSHSPHQNTPPQPQLQHSQSSGSLHAGMTYQNMPSMSQSAYGAQRGIYQQPQAQQAQQQPQQQQQQPQQPPQQSPSPHAYMQQTTAGGGPGIQGWAPPPAQPSHGGQQGWQGY